MKLVGLEFVLVMANVSTLMHLSSIELDETYPYATVIELH